MKYKLFMALTIIGMLDAGYLTYEHYYPAFLPCSGSVFVDCGAVLESEYAVLFGIPLAVLGFTYYLSLFVLGIVSATSSMRVLRSLFRFAILGMTAFGVLFSSYLMYIQLGVIGKICWYCTLSALTSLLLFIVAQLLFRREFVELIGIIASKKYQYILKPIFFSFEPEAVHTFMIKCGEVFGNIPFVRAIFRYYLKTNIPMLRQTYAGITFDKPVGLAAGFDYNGQLTSILEPLDFGFQTIGTVTLQAYKGNARPLLGRLPRSQSLMVNKGFMNNGMPTLLKKLNGRNFSIPVGISIGKTNNESTNTLDKSITDIIESFKLCQKANINNSYFELNISCPNLSGNVNFYAKPNITKLIRAVEALKLKKPLWVKMPIELTDSETLDIMEVLQQFPFVTGIIIGNLQKNKQDPSLVQEEVKQFKAGYFSGKPTFNRSNELISLAYKHYGSRFVIIGCGGVFSGADAYEKIVRGASLIQLITGMIYKGPQLVSSINIELEKLLLRDGFGSIGEAVGAAHKKKQLLNSNVSCSKAR